MTSTTLSNRLVGLSSLLLQLQHRRKDLPLPLHCQQKYPPSPPGMTTSSAQTLPATAQLSPPAATTELLIIENITITHETTHYKL
uniref:Uncharacterized protein n=1 Tax=Romanomermis culicivorax TaxID=13658 RepID=A0A915KXJ0_ROMCU